MFLPFRKWSVNELWKSYQTITFWISPRGVINEQRGHVHECLNQSVVLRRGMQIRLHTCDNRLTRTRTQQSVIRQGNDDCHTCYVQHAVAVQRTALFGQARFGRTMFDYRRIALNVSAGGTTPSPTKDRLKGLIKSRVVLHVSGRT